MDFNEYQKECIKTAQYPDMGNNFVYPTLGISGESGEIAEKIKKVIRDNSGVITEKVRQEISKEIGDVAWYLAMLCTELHLEFGVVAKQNIEKLFDRKKRGVIGGNGDNR